MGLTIHYSLKASQDWSAKDIRAKLETLRQYCRDLPVEEVSEMQEFKGKECQYDEKCDTNEQDENAAQWRWLKIQSGRYLTSPWQPGTSFSQQPSHILAFSVYVAPGSEPMNIGMCTFPAYTICRRKPAENRTSAREFQSDNPAWSQVIDRPKDAPDSTAVLKQFTKNWNLRRLPWSFDAFRHHQRTIVWGDGYYVFVDPGRYLSHRRGYNGERILVELLDRMKARIVWRFRGSVEDGTKLFASTTFKHDIERLVWGEDHHQIPGVKGCWSSFCKTQYANDPRCGGIANFLRAHLSVCAAMERAQQLGFEVRVSDEGGYWKKRDVEELAKEIGRWDQFIAAIVGTMKDVMPPDTVLESAMDKRPDFERLENSGLTGNMKEMAERFRSLVITVSEKTANQE